jgi:2-dehydropantoate 2-reductase
MRHSPAAQDCDFFRHLHVQAMRMRGIRIEMPNMTLELPVRAFNLCDVCTFTERFDIVLLLMKAYDTRWSCQFIEPYLKPDGLIAGVQNGMTTDTIAEVVGAERTMGCVIEISSMMFDPGVVARHSSPARSWFAVGAVDAATKGRESEVADLLRHSGTVEIVDDIRGTKWMKLVSNATTLVSTALVGLSMHEAVALPGMRELMVQALAARLTSPSSRFRRPCRSEVDDLNGLVAAEAARLGRAAPVNAAIADLAHRVEQGTVKPAPSNLRALQDLV